jgi:tripartite-type tricarboxylate transporter receptor subunit TctC
MSTKPHMRAGTIVETTRTVAIFLHIATLVLIGPTGSAIAQSWPTKPIRAIVPAQAGGLTDVVARLVGQSLSKQLGQALIVENRAGAAGTIGAAMVAKAEPDGHTVLIHSSSLTVTAASFAKLPYDVVRDFSAVISLGSSPQVLVVSPSKGYTTARELVAAAKFNPGSVTYAGGLGSAGHFAAERFRLSAGFDGVHVPDKGAPDALRDVVAGRIDFYFSPLLPALPLIRDGQLVALAVSSSRRAPTLPGVPTTEEVGFANSGYEFWNGIFVPARTPHAIVDKLYQETAKILQFPSVKDKLATFGIEVAEMSSAEFGAQVRSEIATNASIIDAIGLKVE